ncbi:MAG: ABC transporter ATP-binding protein [Oscillospiraceae bacterium]|nr:ABC transporter ATP-binding protein [Oscillospiraceae bacterium]
MIELKNVKMCFEDFNALDGVDLTIEAGTAFGLLGSNGAGKSTILRLLSGVYEATEGEVLIDGEPAYDNVAAKQKVFFINDETVQFGAMTLTDMRNYYKGFYPNFSDEIFDKLNAIIKLPEKKRIDKFSKGMKRQAIVITGLAACTDYLLLDEAFDGLDPTMRIIVKRMLVDAMLDRKLTVVISSHNLKEINELCDTAALLHQGKLLFNRDLDSVKGSIHKVQAAFNGDCTENDFEGLDVLHYERNQSITYLIIKGDEETIRTELEKKQPKVLDLIPLTLEEIFIYEMEGMGYDCNGLD